jgi:hypothetical protein
MHSLKRAGPLLARVALFVLFAIILFSYVYHFLCCFCFLMVARFLVSLGYNHSRVASVELVLLVSCIMHISLSMIKPNHSGTSRHNRERYKRDQLVQKLWRMGESGDSESSWIRHLRWEHNGRCQRIHMPPWTNMRRGFRKSSERHAGV